MTRKKKKSTTVIYAGPSLKDLKQYSVFTGELPTYIKNYQENNILKALFIPVSNFSKFRRQVKVEGSKENQIYKKAIEITKGGN
ncbi:hypothetical protein [Gracilibacillus sp. YIM 98692]|uniref:hypothetical protein n=1 Tax=Gracilibacillus sp. YIM 98692 TaxID=2663532 RepID=UPI0013D14F4A|nr:hypothetical protein [Gracilibacillus sp. YIM 98692]